MAEAAEQPVVQQVGKPINLIPVGLKEAALDSPTFRATAIHFSDQVEVIDRWLGDFAKAVARLLTEISVVEELVSGVLARSHPPPSLSEAVLDHDYTVQIIRRFAEGTREYWSHTIAGVRKMESMILEPIRAFMQGELRSFKDARQYLAQAQKSFDGNLSRFASQSRAKELSALREDAFQLYEARKGYLRASMEFSMLAPQLRWALDRLLIRLFSDQWREMRVSSEHTTGFLDKLDSELERIRNWSIELEKGEKVFKSELQSARKNLEDIAAISFRPSRELEEYSAPSSLSHGAMPISTSSSQPPSTPGVAKAEKHGWLFLKTVSGKPARTTWVRRWVFVRSGILGWLTQNTRTGGVEESEQIGVLLCSMRPAPQEERRFCFEVMTKDSNMVLQAETNAELAEWFQVLERAKSAVLDDQGVGPPSSAQQASRDAAFAISPPSAVAFAAKSPETPGHTGLEDGGANLADRASSLLVSDWELRSNLEVSSRRSTASDKEGDSVRDSASRIIQKLDLHRKTAAGSQLASGLPGGSPLAGAAPSGAARASFMSAGYGNNSALAALGSNLLAYTGAAELAPINTSAVNQGFQRGSLERITTLAPATLTVPPAPTNLSKTVVMVSGERTSEGRPYDGSSGIPSGMLANFWGTVTSPLVNRLGREPADHGKPESAESDDPAKDAHGDMNVLSGDNTTTSSVSPSRLPNRSRRNTLPSGGPGPTVPQTGSPPEEYPANYPISLRVQDAQFKLLFPGTTAPEKLVLVFRATWNPNQQQEFPGRVYVTSSSIHFYSHHLGLVLLSSVSLASIDDVTSASGKDFDFLYLHLKDGSNPAGYTRITIKNFLENLRLLQRRLNLLVRNMQTDRSLDLEGVMREFLAMEHDAPPDSPSLESWEAVSTGAMSDDGTWRGRGGEARKERDLHASVRIDRTLDNGADVGPATKETTRLKLPAEPVVHVPKDIDRIAQQKEYSISAKALFHVIFGDRSTVFHALYLGRRAQRVKQSPWMVRDGGTFLKREFEYHAEYTTTLGSVREVNVVDSQEIEVVNDHLCYVVRDTKTPWHLPHAQDFALAMKIVITHVSKSKCRLALYVGVDWARAPVLFRGTVEIQALDDLGEDARILAQVVSDQVTRLGSQSQTKKAVAIFGHVRQQEGLLPYTIGEAAGPSRQTGTALRRRTLVDLSIDSLTSVAASVLSSLLGWASSVVDQVWKYTGAHGFVLALLGLSLLGNLLSASEVTSAWWADRATARFMDKLGVGWDAVVRKSVTLDVMADLSAWQEPAQADPNSNCYATFEALTSPHSSKHSPWTGGTPSSTQRAAHQLAQAQDNIGTYRNGLLVALRIVDSVEREVVQAAWESWLLEETSQCDRVEVIIGQNATGTGTASSDDVAASRDVDDLRRWHNDYCGSCRADLAQLGKGGSGDN